MFLRARRLCYSVAKRQSNYRVLHLENENSNLSNRCCKFRGWAYLRFYRFCTGKGEPCLSWVTSFFWFILETNLHKLGCVWTPIVPVSHLQSDGCSDTTGYFEMTHERTGAAPLSEVPQGCAPRQTPKAGRATKRPIQIAGYLGSPSAVMSRDAFPAGLRYREAWRSRRRREEQEEEEEAAWGAGGGGAGDSRGERGAAAPRAQQRALPARLRRRAGARLPQRDSREGSAGGCCELLQPFYKQIPTAVLWTPTAVL